MKALVHTPYWDSLGGGERYAASFIRLLLDHNWQVDICETHAVAPSVFHRFGLDISKARVVGEYSTLKSLGYNLLFWLSDGSLPTSLAHKTIVHFQFPFHSKRNVS